MSGAPRTTETDLDEDALPGPGDSVAGKYLVTRKLDEGGMGVLFAATHRALNQRVAIKFLKPKYARDAASRERFLREARAAAAITSEHAARIQDVDETPEGVPFIVMELLQGADLGKVVADRGKLPPRDAVGYVLEACEAIAEAHAAGVVHRDLKPSNLFLAERADGSTLVKVLDFGISKSVIRPDDPPGGTSLTAPNTLLGSPQYMSPEQVCDAKTVDLRSDVWALGVILYELVAGAPPFDADSAAALFAKILSEKPAPLRKLVPEAPAGLSDVVMRCLVKEPSGRPKSVAELAVALRPFAPPGSDPRIEKIQRVLARAPESTGRSAVGAETIDALAPTMLSQRSGGRAVVALGLAGVVAVVALGLFLARTERPAAVGEAPGTAAPAPTSNGGADSAQAVKATPALAGRTGVGSTAASAAPLGSAASAGVRAGLDSSGPTALPTGAADANVERRPTAARKSAASGGKLKDLSQIQLLQ